MLMTKDEEIKMVNSYRLTRIDDYVNKRSEEFVNCKNLEVINYEHYKQLLYDLRASLRSYPDMEFINNYIKDTRKEIHKPLFPCYGKGGFTKEIKISPEEAEKLKSELIEWDGEFYPKSVFKWKNPEDLYKLCMNQQIQLKFLHSIIEEIKELVEGVDCLGLRNGKMFISSLLNDIIKILDKVKESDYMKAIDGEWLNMNAEIIEEDKKIEKIEMCTGGIMSFDSVENITTELKNKINEIIDKINEMEEVEKEEK